MRVLIEIIDYFFRTFERKTANVRYYALASKNTIYCVGEEYVTLQAKNLFQKDYQTELFEF